MRKDLVLKIGVCGLIGAVWSMYFLVALYANFFETLWQISTDLGVSGQPFELNLFIPGAFGFVFGGIVGGLVGAEKSRLALLSIIPLSIFGFYYVFKLVLIIVIIGFVAFSLAWIPRLVIERVILKE